MKKHVLAAFVGFLLFMAVCTVVTKGIYKAQIAKVWVCRLERKSITHEISGVGSSAPGLETGIYTVEGIRVSAVYVRTGERIGEGTPLFSLDPEDLEQKIQETEAQIRYQKAQIKDISEEKKSRTKERQTEAERLAEDYDGLVLEHDLRIRELQLAADTARLRMQEDQIAALQGRHDLEAGNDLSVSGGDLEGEVRRLQLAAELSGLEYERALNAIEEAKLQKENTLKEWKRRMEDAGKDSYAQQAQSVALSGELALNEKKLERLNAAAEAGGIVYAPEEGLILENFLQVGERTRDGACMLYAAWDDSGYIQVPVEEKDGFLPSVGDTVTLRYKTAQGENKKEQGRISYIEQKDGQKILNIYTEGGALLPGQTVYMETAVKSEAYEKVLPGNAVHGDEVSGYYVYVVEQREGVLGTEERVRKIPVLVPEKNENYCAVQSVALDADNAVILDSSGALAEDSVVRVMGER